MVNSVGMIKGSIWGDPEFRSLPRHAQCMYAQLLSLKVDRAGMLPLHVAHWAKGCDELTESEVWDDLKLLAARRFIVLDEDTDEVFIRTYMRHNQMGKYPQFVKAAIRAARLVESPILRAEVAVELTKLGRPEASACAAELNGAGTLPEPFENPAGTVPEGFSNPAVTVNPSGTVREGWGSGSGSGTGSPSVGGYVGEAPAETCPKHPNGSSQPCGPCRQARRSFEAWTDAQAAADAERRATRRKQIDACPYCDDNALREIPGGVTRCSHDPSTFSTEASHA